MKRVADIIKNIANLAIEGVIDLEISGLSLDSRTVKENYLYAAIVGTQTDGHQYIDQAIENGATVILCNNKYVQNKTATYLITADVSKTLGLLAANYYDNPSNQLEVVAITGTNGKTTCASILYELFTEMGYHCGLLSTVAIRIGQKTLNASHTTPNAIAIQETMALMVKEGCTYCFMEASSHAIHQQRISGLKIAIAGFTNLSHDHLDYHHTFAEYRDAKKILFDQLPSEAFAISNKDDKNGVIMLQNTKASKFYYSLKQPADFKGKIIEMDIEGMLLNINEQEAWYRLTGGFNASNLLLVYGIAFLLGKMGEEIITSLSKVGRVAGRFETIKSISGITGIIDYAHTPDALLNLLITVNSIRTKNEKLYLIFGCGGNRDKTKRPEMGNIAAKNSDKVIITSDNPRNENEEDIIEDILKGVEPTDFKKIITISKRDQAIKTAVAMAEKGDIIIIAGKGHEQYQEINGLKHPFDDASFLKKAFKELEK